MMYITITEHEYQELIRIKRKVQALIGYKKSLLSSALKYDKDNVDKQEVLFYEMKDLEELLA